MLFKQPILGVSATIVIVLLSFAFISLFSVVNFVTWVSLILMCAVPLQLLIGPFWHGQHPPSFARLKQPMRGLLYTLTTLVLSAVIACVIFATIGGAYGPPRPQALMFTILSVVVSFWAIFIWGGWPITSMVKQPLARGLCILLLVYLVTYLLFVFLFDFRFMAGAPVYVESLDPKGLVNAWQVLVFAVTTVASMFVFVNFDLWPMARSERMMTQPMLGLVWSLGVLLISGVAFYLGTQALQTEVVAFLINVPIFIIFGSIIVLNMLQGSLFTAIKQPLKGCLNLVAVIIVGQLFHWLYQSVSPLISGKLLAGPPAHDLEIWLASATLAVTFPLMIVFADFFQFWPLKRTSKST